jgi:hypothetical protein
MPPARTDEARESQLVSVAMDLAEKQMLEGTASSQVITHFLKQGSLRDRLERDRLAREVELLEAKVESMASARRVEDLYEAAIQAMRTYAGLDSDVDDVYDD